MVKEISSAEVDKHVSAGSPETITSNPQQSSGLFKEGGDIEQIDNDTFLEALFSEMPEGSCVAVCTKPGDPKDDRGWFALKTVKGTKLPPGNNNYFNISSFHPAADGSFNVKKENFAALHCAVADDVGSKIPWSRLEGIEPTWVIETSPGNCQVGFILKEPITEIEDAESLINTVIDAGLSDKGMSGVSRWARLPRGINGKAKYLADGKPFPCRLVQWNPARTYSFDELVVTLDLTLEAPKKSKKTPLADAATTNDAVIAELEKRGLYKRVISPGKHDITCPWVSEHSDEIDDGAAYFEPSADFSKGGFKCHHSHGDDYNIRDLRTFLGLEKPIIQINPGQMDEAIKTAGKIIAEDPKIFYFGNVLGRIQTEDNGEVGFNPFNNADLTLLLAQRIQWLKFKGEDLVPCDPPERYVRVLFDGGATAGVIPELKGIARQPYFREVDGELVTKPGYDTVSRLYGAFDPEEFQRLEPTRENADVSLALLRGLLTEFCFVRCADDSVPLVAMMTAAIRASLNLAPGFHVHGSTIGTGKTYFCELVALFASAAPAQKVSYPKNDEDATKKMLSLLMKSPACIEFDDMSTNWKPFTILKQSFTAEAVTDRLLGVNKTATVSTRCLILGSGNNVEPERDMLRRVLTMYLDPQVENPIGISYEGDPVAMVKNNRGRYVMAVINIIESWIEAGRPMSELQDIASYNGAWTTYCRQPLAWLGVGDPVAALVEQVTHDPDREVLGELLEAWHTAHGDAAVTVRRVLNGDSSYQFKVNLADQCPHDRLKEAIEDLPIVERGYVSAGKLGWFLKKNANKIVNGLKFIEAWADGRRAWRVVKVG